ERDDSVGRAVGPLDEVRVQCEHGAVEARQEYHGVPSLERQREPLPGLANELSAGRPRTFVNSRGRRRYLAGAAPPLVARTPGLPGRSTLEVDQVLEQ